MPYDSVARLRCSISRRSEHLWTKKRRLRWVEQLLVGAGGVSRQGRCPVPLKRKNMVDLVLSCKLFSKTMVMVCYGAWNPSKIDSWMLGSRYNQAFTITKNAIPRREAIPPGNAIHHQVHGIGRRGLVRARVCARLRASARGLRVWRGSCVGGAAVSGAAG